MTTLKDIAQAAGVSQATVSRVLNGGKGISAATCARVMDIARELNYIPNVSAKILAGKRSRMIGMIVPEIDSNYFAPMICEVEHQLQKQGYFLLIANTQYQSEKEVQALNTFCTYHVDGIFMTCTVNTDILAQFEPVLEQNHIPVVLLEARVHTDKYSYIMVDDEGGMSEAISYLRGLGYDRVGFIGDYILDTLRTVRFRNALRRNGMDPADNPVYSNPLHRFEIGGYETMQRILADPDRPSAFLAGYDDIAIGAIRALREAGLRTPEDIRIIGNDNIRESPYLYKSLSTLSPPINQLARIGTEIMISAAAGHEKNVIRHIQLKPELIIRETA